MSIQIRKATREDLDAISEIYDQIHASAERGETYTGWLRGVYPVRATAEAALERGDLFIEEADGQPVGTAIINRIQVDVYRNAEWQYPAPDDQIMVLHTLVIDPRAKGRGLGRAFVDYYDAGTARDCGCRYLRMDTNALNRKCPRVLQETELSGDRDSALRFQRHFEYPAGSARKMSVKKGA